MSPHSHEIPRQDVYVATFTRFELTAAIAALVEAADVISGELPFLKGAEHEEGAKLRAVLNAMISRLMDMR
jgi:hypothetical protein